MFQTTSIHWESAQRHRVTEEEVDQFFQFYVDTATYYRIPVPAKLIRKIAAAKEKKADENRLSKLSLKKSNLTDDQVKVLAVTLAKYPIIGALDLRNNWITLQGWSAIMKAMQSHIYQALASSSSGGDGAPPTKDNGRGRLSCLHYIMLEGNPVMSNSAVLEEISAYQAILSFANAKLGVWYAFYDSDRGKKGFLTPVEIQSAVYEILGYSPKNWQMAKAILNQYDQEQLSLQSFEAGMSRVLQQKKYISTLPKESVFILETYMATADVCEPKACGLKTPKASSLASTSRASLASTARELDFSESARRKSSIFDATSDGTRSPSKRRTLFETLSPQAFLRRSKYGKKGSGNPEQVFSFQGPPPNESDFKPMELDPVMAERSTSVDDEGEGEGSLKGQPKVFLSTIAKRLLDQAAEKQDLSMSFDDVVRSSNHSPRVSIVMSAPSSPRRSTVVSATSSPRMVTVSSAPSSPRFGTVLSVQDAIKTLRSRTPSPQLQELPVDEAVGSHKSSAAPTSPRISKIEADLWGENQNLDEASIDLSIHTADKADTSELEYTQPGLGETVRSISPIAESPEGGCTVESSDELACTDLTMLPGDEETEDPGFLSSKTVEYDSEVRPIGGSQENEGSPLLAKKSSGEKEQASETGENGDETKESIKSPKRANSLAGLATIDPSALSIRTEIENFSDLQMTITALQKIGRQEGILHKATLFEIAPRKEDKEQWKAWDGTLKIAQAGLSQVDLSETINKQGLGGFLHTLCLSSNQIRSIDAISLGLQSLQALRILDLSHNLIEDMTCLNGTLPTSLQGLDLSDNIITKIVGLTGCGDLRELKLAANRISFVDGLESCDSLEYLDMSYNRLKKPISIRALSFNESLKHLLLAGNPLCRIFGYGRIAVTFCPSLETLDGARAKLGPKAPRHSSPKDKKEELQNKTLISRRSQAQADAKRSSSFQRMLDNKRHERDRVIKSMLRNSPTVPFRHQQKHVENLSAPKLQKQIMKRQFLVAFGSHLEPMYKNESRRPKPANRSIIEKLMVARSFKSGNEILKEPSEEGKPKAMMSSPKKDGEQGDPLICKATSGSKLKNPQRERRVVKGEDRARKFGGSEMEETRDLPLIIVQARLKDWLEDAEEDIATTINAIQMLMKLYYEGKNEDQDFLDNFMGVAEELSLLDEPKLPDVLVRSLNVGTIPKDSAEATTARDTLAKALSLKKDLNSFLGMLLGQPQSVPKIEEFLDYFKGTWGIKATKGDAEDKIPTGAKTTVTGLAEADDERFEAAAKTEFHFEEEEDSAELSSVSLTASSRSNTPRNKMSTGEGIPKPTSCKSSRNSSSESASTLKAGKETSHSNSCHLSYDDGELQEAERESTAESLGYSSSDDSDGRRERLSSPRRTYHDDEAGPYDLSSIHELDAEQNISFSQSNRELQEGRRLSPKYESVREFDERSGNELGRSQSPSLNGSRSTEQKAPSDETSAQTEDSSLSSSKGIGQNTSPSLEFAPLSPDRNKLNVSSGLKHDNHMKKGTDNLDDRSQKRRSQGDAEDTKGGEEDLASGEYEWIEGFDETYQQYFYFNEKTGVSQWHKPGEPYVPFEEDDQEGGEEQEDGSQGHVNSLLEVEQERSGQIKNPEPKSRTKLDLVEDGATSRLGSKLFADSDVDGLVEQTPLDRSMIKKQASLSQMIASRFGFKKGERSDESLSRPSQEQEGPSKLKKPLSFSLLPTRSLRSQSDQKPIRKGGLRSIFFRSSSHG